MTLTRRMALFIATVLLLALGGAWVIHTLGARQTLQQQLDMRNRDAAAALALALSQQGGDTTAIRAVASAQFDLGHYRSIVLRSVAGQPLVDLQQAPAAVHAPDWFMALLPLQVAPGTALVSSGWTEIGTLTVHAQTSWAQDSLWAAALRTAGLLAVLAVAAAAVSAWMLRAWQRPLLATVAQALALEQGRFVLADEPSLPELKRLTRSMNATVRRLREMFATQAEQVAHLQRRAQLDSLTGLPLRAHLVQALDRQLARYGGQGGQGGQGASLLLVRVGQLEQINQQRGREAADAVLRLVAGVLLRQVQQEPDTLGGRLSGSDFALCFPLPGMAAELAPMLHRMLREAATQAAPGLAVPARVLVAAVEGLAAPQAEAALAMATWSLARAEAGSMGLQIEPLAPSAAAQASPAAWQARMASALAEGRMRLAEFPVVDAQGSLIHLECPLRLQLDAEGEFEPAARWLAMARRCGMVPQVDQAAIRLILQAIAQDGRPRAVNVALSSLSTPGLADGVTALLAAAPESARKLSIEWVEGGRTNEWTAVERTLQHWQSLGVRMGVEHAGAAPEHLPALRDLGLDYVKVDGLHLRGAAGDPAVNAYARSLLGLIQLLGLKAYAEGVDRSDDLAALWALGFEGATGSALGTAAAASGGSEAVGAPWPATPAEAAAWVRPAPDTHTASTGS